MKPCTPGRWSDETPPVRLQLDEGSRAAFAHALPAQRASYGGRTQAPLRLGQLLRLSHRRGLLPDRKRARLHPLPDPRGLLQPQRRHGRCRRHRPARLGTQPQGQQPHPQHRKGADGQRRPPRTRPRRWSTGRDLDRPADRGGARAHYPRTQRQRGRPRAHAFPPVRDVSGGLQGADGQPARRLESHVSRHTVERRRVRDRSPSASAHAALVAPR